MAHRFVMTILQEQTGRDPRIVLGRVDGRKIIVRSNLWI